jgi:pyruvate decarboxylase
MVHKPVQTSALERPLFLNRPSNSTTEEEALHVVLSALYSARNPVMLVDALILQFGLKLLVRRLLGFLKFPTFCPFMGKSVIEETEPYFYGTYNGKFSYPGIQESVEEDSDLVIHIGPLPTDMNTGGFSAKINPEKLILIQKSQVNFKGQVFEGIYLESCKCTRPQYLSCICDDVDNAVLTRLLNSLDISKLSKIAPLSLPVPSPQGGSEIQETKITQSYLWPRMGKFFRSDDIVFADGGTTHFGLQDADFPDITYIMQNYWASIGYALPATFGGAMARRDLKKSKTEGWNGVKGEGDGRVIFITGEGAMQLTVQEVGSIIREELDILMLVPVTNP